MTLASAVPESLDITIVLCINQHMKFEVPSFTDFKDMIGAKI